MDDFDAFELDIPRSSSIAEEELGFIQRMINGESISNAARGTLVPEDASTALALKTGQAALAHRDVRAEIEAIYSRAGMPDAGVEAARTLQRNLNAKKYALWQVNGTKVEIGDDGQVQVQAAKIILQTLQLTGGGVPEPRVDKAEARPEVHLHFGNAALDGDNDDDGDVVDQDGRPFGPD